MITLAKPTSLRWQILLAAVSFAVLLTVSPPVLANVAEPEWHPESSERLVKLPATYLKKSLDRDFAESALGNALQSANEELGAKTGTLAELQKAIGKSDGELRMEMRHQFLHEKRAYVELMARRNELQRKHVAIQTRLLEDMLARMRPGASGETPGRMELIKRQDAARTRFESSLASVDMALFNSSSAPESKYAAKYAENSAAIEQLVARIQTHNMNDTPTADGETMTREDYVRQMLADAHAEAAILDQDGTILGYMAKLVALDALALAEEALDPNASESLVSDRSAPAANVQFFITN
jgi:hypothetical protein